MPDLTPLAESVGALLKERGEKIAVADSSAGGLISAALLSVPGASAYYIGGIVSYTGVSRVALLGISEDDMARVGMRASTEPYAALIAKTVREKMGADWGIAENGGERADGQSLRRRRRARVLRGLRGRRARRHPRDGQPGPGGEHVGLRGAGAGTAGGVPAGGLVGGVSLGARDTLRLPLGRGDGGGGRTFVSRP